MADPSFRIAAVDLNGQLRGKRLPYDNAGARKRLPLSASNVDIFGADIDGSPLVFDSGDQDGWLIPDERGPIPLPWLQAPGVLQLAHLIHDDETPFPGDPRYGLSQVLNRYSERGWSVTAACELEFFLNSGARSLDVLSIRALDDIEPFFNDLETGAKVMNLGGLAITSEGGLGQFEVTMHHGPAAKAADDVLLLKELIKGTAHRHGMTASFVAKPFADDAGNGLHTHFSITDADGNSVLDDVQTLRQAVAGTLQALPSQSLIFAPYPNSYARFTNNAHAPTCANWGFDNRTVAIRIPGGVRRIEHRVAGGDICPHLMFAAIFGAALDGVERRLEPPAPVTGNGYDTPPELPGMAPNAATAIDLFALADHSAWMNPDLAANFLMTKRQDFAKLADLGPDAEISFLTPMV